MTTPDSTSPHVLIVTDSRHGATREIGDSVRAVLVAAVLGSTTSQPLTSSRSAATTQRSWVPRVYIGHWLPELRRLVEENAPSLALVPVWLFESGPLGDEPAAPSDDLTALERQLSASSRVFQGRLDRASLGRGERILTRLVHAPYGDFRSVDDIRAWHPPLPRVSPQARRACIRPEGQRVKPRHAGTKPEAAGPLPLLRGMAAWSRDVTTTDGRPLGAYCFRHSPHSRPGRAGPPLSSAVPSRSDFRP